MYLKLEVYLAWCIDYLQVWKRNIVSNRWLLHKRIFRCVFIAKKCVCSNCETAGLDLLLIVLRHHSVMWVSDRCILILYWIYSAKKYSLHTIYIKYGLYHCDVNLLVISSCHHIKFSVLIVLLPWLRLFWVQYLISIPILILNRNYENTLIYIQFKYHKVLYNYCLILNPLRLLPYLYI